MSQKRIRRIKETNLEYEETVANNVIDSLTKSKSDEDVFTIDFIGSKSKRRKIIKQKENEKLNITSTTDKKLVEKFLKNPSAFTKTSDKLTNLPNKLHDLWNDESLDHVSNNKSPNTKNKKAITSIIKPGQSYNPSLIDHQNVLANALALEMKRREDEIKMQSPFVPPEITNALQSFDDSDDESIDDAVAYQPIKGKLKERLTRAKRNKIKAKNMLSAEGSQKLNEEKFLKTIDKLPLIMKESAKNEREKELKIKLRSLRKQKKFDSDNDPNRLSIDEVAVVPLSDELSGSLRRIVPKGVPIKLQTVKMLKDGKLTPRDRRKRNKRDKPHGAKRVVWVAKYKYKV